VTPVPIIKSTLFYGNNLPILREYVPDESIDPLYLDPPLNSKLPLPTQAFRPGSVRGEKRRPR